MFRLIFVYNADSGMLNGLTDLLHKTLSPSTYPCNLCAITYDSFGMRTQWRSFLRKLDVPVDFLHRDEFGQRFGTIEADLPAAFVQRDEKPPVVWIDAARMAQFESVDDIIAEVEQGLSQLVDASATGSPSAESESRQGPLANH